MLLLINMARQGAVGYIRQQTVNCDFVECKNSIKTHILDAATIISPLIDSLVADVANLRDEVLQLRLAIGGFEQGSSVESTLHFDDVDLDDTSFDVENYKQELMERIANSLGVEASMVSLRDVSSTGSATVRFAVKFPAFPDAVQTELYEAKRDQLVSLLSNENEVQELFSDLGGVQVVEQAEIKDIQGIESKVYKLEKMLTSEEIDFGASRSFLIDKYRLEVDQNELKIRRFDDQSNEYVGGTVILD